MIDATSRLGDLSTASLVHHYAKALSGFYRDLLDVGIPPHLASLVQRIERAGGRGSSRRRALVVEPHEVSRSAALILLRETGLEVSGCSRAREALDFLRVRGNDTAFVFCDEQLAGERSGVELTEAISILWPGIHIVLTADESVDPPPNVARLTKPWKALDLLVQAERALKPEPLQL